MKHLPRSLIYPGPLALTSTKRLKDVGKMLGVPEPKVGVTFVVRDVTSSVKPNMKQSIEQEERLQRIKAGAFLASVAGISAFVGFGATLAAAKKTDPKYFSKGLHASPELADAGAILALRALGWGTVYAVTGVSFLCYGIWKLSGAKDLKDFRIKMGNMLPVLPKNNPPQSRTEFSGMNDLMTYLSEEYGKKSKVEK